MQHRGVRSLAYRCVFALDVLPYRHLRQKWTTHATILNIFGKLGGLFWQRDDLLTPTILDSTGSKQGELLLQMEPTNPP